MLSVAFSPDGKRLACGVMDGTVALFDVPSGQLMHTLTGHHKPVRDVCFTPGQCAILLFINTHSVASLTSEVGLPFLTATRITHFLQLAASSLRIKQADFCEEGAANDKRVAYPVLNLLRRAFCGVQIHGCC